MNNHNTEPLYLRVKSSLHDDICNGKYEIGQKIPSTKKLCSIYDVSAITARRAVSELISEGVLRSVMSKGVYVASPSPGVSMSTKVMGVIVPFNEVDSFSSLILKGIQEICGLWGYRTLLSSSNNNEDDEAKLIDSLTADGVSGIITVPCSQRDTGAAIEAISRCKKSGIPLVYTDFKPVGANVTTVTINNKKSMKGLTNKLIESGHSEIAFLLTEDVPSLNDRYEGYTSALKDAGISLSNDYVVERQPHLDRIESARTSTMNLLNLSKPPSALICATDEISIGAYKACYELSITPGKDISIVSFGYNSRNDFLFPTITATKLPLVEMGRNAASIVLRKLSDEGYAGPEEIILNTSMHEGASCCPLKK